MSDKWRRSLLGYNVSQFESAHKDLEHKHRQAVTQMESELTSLRAECVSLRDQLSDLERELRASNRERSRQGTAHPLQPAGSWLRLRTKQEAAPAADDDRDEP